MESARRFCRRVPIKMAVSLVALWGLVFGIINYLKIVERSIYYSDLGHHKWKINAVYDIFEILMFEYIEVLMIIFSMYLLYGTWRDFSEKSIFVFSWILYAAVADIYSTFYFLLAIIKHGSSAAFNIIDMVLHYGAQFLCLVLVFYYYRSLPKKKFEST